MSTDRIEKQILLHCSQSRVWRAIADSAEFGTWFGVKIDSPFKAGAQMRCIIAPTKVDDEVAKTQQSYEGTPFDITIEQIEPERLFSFRWHPFGVDKTVDYSAEPTTLVTFTLTPQSTGVLLTITETGFDRIPLERRAKAFAANDGGWSHQMQLIEKYLAHA